jgi:glycolate oxidase FAD binding subunit
LSDVLRPATEWELQSMMGALHERQISIEVVGAGSKRGAGRPATAAGVLTTAGLRGITLYEPTELVMSARAGTPVSQIEVELASRSQMLPFEPVDPGPMLGGAPGVQTIGGVFATNFSGARRISAGGARDHILGIRAINGRAEAFKAGGRVMKNVTGYDIARGLTGSWGTLAILTEATFKVLPLPDDVATLVYFGHTDEIAAELMCAAMGSPFEISGTAHLTEALAARIRNDEIVVERKSATALRLENFTKSIHYRKERLKSALAAYGEPLELDLESSLRLWGELRRLSVFPFGSHQIWRISASPRMAPKLVAAIRRHMPVETYYDWSGGLAWIETPATADAGAADIRRAVASFGGHATLVRADESVRRSVDVFQPMSPGVERLTQGLKSAFDPLGILNPGRMYATL